MIHIHPFMLKQRKKQNNHSNSPVYVDKDKAVEIDGVDYFKLASL
jgi:hypothetical protein